MLMIGFDDRPQREDSQIIDLVADHKVRFMLGYVLYAGALTFMALAVLHVAARARESGSATLGGIGPVLFLIGAAAIILGGHGIMGAALIPGMQAASARDYYLESLNDSPATVVAQVGAIFCALCLVMLAAAVWRTRLFAGPAAVAVPVGFVALGLAFVVTAGWTVSTFSLLLPVSGAIALYPFVWRELMPDAATAVSTA